MQQNVRGWIASALEGSGWTPEEVWEGVQQGVFHLFMHEEGCMVGEFIVSPRAVGFNVFAAGGTLKAIRELLPMVENYARSRGATFGGASGRKGWVRFLKRYGYAPEVCLQKEL